MVKVIRFLFGLLESICTGILEAGFEGLTSIFIKERTKEYSAEFGSPDSQLQKEPGGFRIGYQWGNSLIESNSHMIAFGGSGSKKSSSIVFNTLLQSHDSSYVVFDCAGELSSTAAYKMSLGYSRYWLNMDDHTKSIGINWLPLCKSESDVYGGMQVLFKNANGDATQDYWVQSAENLAGFFAFALVSYAPFEYVNMSNVLNMIEIFSYAPERIDRWMVATGNEKIISRYKSLLATPEKTLQSTISTATNSLAIYNSPTIAAITSQNTLPFEEFRNRKCILYVCGSPSTIQYTRSIFASYFESFFGHILQKMPQPSCLNLTFLIDEANTMRLQSLGRILELGRKYRVSVATLWQDYKQIENIYNTKQAANILANSKLKAYLPSGQPIETCRMLSEILGKYSYEDNKGVSKTRELLTAQEIFQLKEILLLNGNNKPMLLEPKPYFENKKLRQLTELPAADMDSPVSLCVPPLLKFE